MSTVKAIADAVAAISNAAKRDPVAQRINAESRARRRDTRRSRRWLRSVSEATGRLAAADRADDLEGMVSAVLELHALGIDENDIADAHDTALRLQSDG